MDKNYRTNPTNRTIMGHSFGGYFVSLILLNDMRGKPAFTNYVAASPSLWYSNGYIVKQFDSLSSIGGNSNTARFFLTSGEEELKFGNEDYFDSIIASITKLQLIKINSKVYPHLDHMGAAIPSFEDAIRELFGHKEESE